MDVERIRMNTISEEQRFSRCTRVRSVCEGEEGGEWVRGGWGKKG